MIQNQILADLHNLPLLLTFSDCKSLHLLAIPVYIAEVLRVQGLNAQDDVRMSQPEVFRPCNGCLGRRRQRLACLPPGKA